MEIVKKQVSELHPATYNPRKITDKNLERLKHNIKEFGLVETLVWNKRTNRLISGHQRLKVLIEEGIKEVEVSVVDLNEDKEKALNISLNNLNLQGEWEEEKLAELLQDLQEKDLTDLTGFEDKEVSQLLDLLKEVEEDDFEEPAKPKYKVERGDLFQLKNHRLLCGDSTIKEDVEKLMGGGKADIIFTDPPYNVNYDYTKVGCDNEKGNKYGKGPQVFNDKLKPEEFKEFIKNVFVNAKLFSKPDICLYCCYALGNYIQFREGIEQAGFKYRQSIIWIKDSIVFARGEEYHRCYEPIMYCKIGKPYVNKKLSNWKDIWNLTLNEFEDTLNIWYAKRELGHYVHPTQKPIHLIEKAFRKSTQEGFIVLDLFGGSGSTLITAEQMNRKAYLMELDPKYISVIIERYINLVGEGNVFKINPNGEKIPIKELIITPQ